MEKKKEKDKKEHAFFPFSLSLSLLPARLRDSLLRSSLFHVSPFNFNSFSSTLSLSLSFDLLLTSFHFTFSQNIDHYRYSLSAAMKRKRFVDGFTICSKGYTTIPFGNVPPGNGAFLFRVIDRDSCISASIGPASEK